MTHDILIQHIISHDTSGEMDADQLKAVAEAEAENDEIEIDELMDEEDEEAADDDADE